MLTVIIFRFFIPWILLVSAARYWVGVDNTSFCVLYALFTTLTRGSWAFSLLYYYNASIMSFFTVLSSSRRWWFVSDCKRFPWWWAVPCMVFPRFFLIFSKLLQNASLILPKSIYLVSFHASWPVISQNHSYSWWCSKLFRLAICLSMGSSPIILTFIDLRFVWVWCLMVISACRQFPLRLTFYMIVYVKRVMYD